MDTTNMAIINWTYQGDDSRQLSPRDIADRFAADPAVGDRPRTVGYLDGDWYGIDWAGEFMLAGGRNTYHLTFNGDTSTWAVSD